MNWKAFAVGAALAAVAGVLHYMQTLPPPWGSLADALIVLVALFTPKPNAPVPVPAVSAKAPDTLRMP